MSAPLILPLLDEGLGNQSYLVDLGDGTALVVDPTLDLRALDAAADELGLRVAYAAETHLHADFISGAVRLARRDGAKIIGSAAGARQFDHLGVEDGQELDLGGLTLRSWATPGHTDEHVSYLLMDADLPLAVFTGGSLLVGAAARTDLQGPELTEPLARAQFRSLRRLAQLPDSTRVFPTHGQGSFCSAPPGADRVSTIGRERATNPLLALADEDGFVEALFSRLGSYPPYFARLGRINQAGPATPGPVELAELGVTEVAALLEGGADLVDVRPVVDYAAAHVPGSISIALRPAFATWLGWTVSDPARPLILVRDPQQDLPEILWQARKVGYDNIVGELGGGVAAWQRAGRPTATTGIADVSEVAAAEIVDVRQRSEYAAGHVPGALGVELGLLTDPAGLGLTVGPVVVMCGHGERAATGASLLERAGRSDVRLLVAGPDDWSEATGRAIAVGA